MCHSFKMVAKTLVTRLLEQIRSTLQLVVEPRLRDIDSKLDHVIETLRESRAKESCRDWRRYE